MILMDFPYDPAYGRAVSDVAQQACVHQVIWGLPQPATIQDAARVSAAPTVTATTFLVVSSHFSVLQDVELGQALVHDQWVKCIETFALEGKAYFMY
jgi:hypothetical protein